MLFNSFEFILAFLPIVFILYHLLISRGFFRISVGILVVASLFFYAWWNPKYLLLIAASVCFNFLAGNFIARGGRYAKSILIFSIIVNLAAIGYFKYTNFVVGNLSPDLATYWSLENIILPLGISFYTFQQITYLVDSYNNRKMHGSFLDYCLFVTFFPQLIAGPIVHHSEMMPQFEKIGERGVNNRLIAVGISIFVIGLFKKTVLADSIATYSTPVYNFAETGGVVDFAAAWVAALGFTLQLYFDFSGYSDMAIGLGNMFGIRLPLNFYSPYKSASIIDFWRRWHITLSRFLRDYVYIPLGGNRRGSRSMNVFLTMLIGGIWHGAGWTFIIWGCLHGFYIVVNGWWRELTRGLPKIVPKRVSTILAWSLTFLLVIFAWVIFRAVTVSGALAILGGMIGLNGFSFSLKQAGIRGDPTELLCWFAALLAIAFLMPNCQQIFVAHRPTITRYKGEPTKRTWILWSRTALWAVTIGALFIVAIYFMSSTSEFLYFQF